jgi:hypothetical protein
MPKKPPTASNSPKSGTIASINPGDRSYLKESKFPDTVLKITLGNQAHIECVWIWVDQERGNGIASCDKQLIFGRFLSRSCVLLE